MSLWQTKSWQEMLKKSWQTEEYFEIPTSPQAPLLNKERIAEVIFVEKRKVAFGEYGLFVVGGEETICRDVINLVSTLKNLCKQENCLFIQIETLDYSVSQEENKDALKCTSTGGFKSSYYKKFIPPYTAVIDLTKSEEEILTEMKPKGRYNINLAKKKWVTCEIVEKTKKNIHIFYDLLQETTSRDGFSGNSLKYYENFLEKIADSELILAKFEEKYIAWGIFIFPKNEVALYYYGASSNEARNLMAPYLVQWTAIKEAKKQNCTLYDFLGVAGEWETNSPLAGVTDFKLKFTSDRRLVSESYLRVHKKWKYRLIQLLKKLKKNS